MFFSQLYQEKCPVFSLEFFPPKKEESLNLTMAQIAALSEVSPDFMTVTYGAGGGTREHTRSLVTYIHNDLKRPAVAHLTCVGSSVSEIDLVLDELQEVGITNILALRGDPPRGEKRFVAHREGFQCAMELTNHIAKRGGFSLAVAGYPETHQEAESAEADIAYLKRKVDAGAEAVITQLFFEEQLYFSFRERAEKAGISVPIVPGIMPIANVGQVERFTNMCGASIPKPLHAELIERKQDRESVIRFGTDYAIELCGKLLEGGAPGIHLYTLNKSVQVRPILEVLKAEHE